MRILLLALPLLFFAGASRAGEGRALPPSGLREREAPRPPKSHSSPDRRLRWTEGSAFVSVYKPGKRRPSRRIRLPPLKEKTARRKVLFPGRGDFFCVVDEQVQELGLHLGVERGAKAAKAVVVSSWLRLVDSFGRVRWGKRLRDKHVVGRPGESPLRIAEDGTLAVLLQDADPYTKARPLLLVFSPRGRRMLQIDYLDFKHIDEFALSRDGKLVAVRGYGRVADRETWGKAIAVYSSQGEKQWVRPIPRAADARTLKFIDSKGNVCCVREGEDYVAYGAKRGRTVIDPIEAASRYGLEP